MAERNSISASVEKLRHLANARIARKAKSESSVITSATSVRLSARMNSIGVRFGRLVVIGPSFLIPRKNGNRKALAVARCDCGNVTVISVASARFGKVRSCGCLISECESNYKHGLCRVNNKHPIANVWNGIKGRCCCPTNDAWNLYGGRGISICNEWKDNLPAFYDWAISNGYRKGLTIDRIDNDKGYSPDNCRWVTMLTQNNNKSTNVIITAFGETKNLCEWCRDERCRVSEGAIRHRLKQGWSAERAIASPPRSRKKSQALSIELKESR